MTNKYLTGNQNGRNIPPGFYYRYTMYRFEYLREGTYKVFAYSKDSAAYPLARKTEVMKEVTITEKNQVVTVEDIIVLN